jgi:CheY-like chemotaxis protein
MTNGKIMVIDDNKEFSEELRETLDLCGYDVMAISDSANALKLARKIKPSAILLDLRMSGSNGFQVAQNLKDANDTARIPIIAMSGYFPIENRSILLDMHNMDGRIKKPFDISDLITEIESVLNKH